MQPLSYVSRQPGTINTTSACKLLVRPGLSEPGSRWTSTSRASNFALLAKGSAQCDDYDIPRLLSFNQNHANFLPSISSIPKIFEPLTLLFWPILQLFSSPPSSFFPSYPPSPTFIPTTVIHPLQLSILHHHCRCYRLLLLLLYFRHFQIAISNPSSLTSIPVLILKLTSTPNQFINIHLVTFLVLLSCHSTLPPKPSHSHIILLWIPLVTAGAQIITILPILPSNSESSLHTIIHAESGCKSTYLYYQ